MANATITVFPFEIDAPVAASKTRLGWVDTARGITILLVVMGHANLPYELQSFFQPFRLPLFYLTAGFLFNFDRHCDKLGNYMTQRLKRLVLPYFVTAFFFYVVWLVVSGLVPQREVFDPAKQLIGLFLASGMSAGAGEYVIHFDLALWFLGCMAVSTFIFVGLLHIFRNETSHLPLLMASVGVATLGRVIGERWVLPWSADVAMVAQLFFVIGFLMRRHGVVFTNTRIFLLMVAIYYGLYYFGDQTDMNRRIYPDFSKFCMAGLAGTYAVYYLSKKLFAMAETDPAARLISDKLEFLGRNTMVIMAFHMGGGPLRQFVGEYLLGLSPMPYPTPFIESFLWMSAASLIAIAALNAVPPLKKIYYK